MALYYSLQINPEKSVKLRMSVKDIINLEKSLGGKNPLSIFGNLDTDGGMNGLPSWEVIAKVLQHSLQKFEHGYDYNATCDLIEEYMDNDGENTRSYTELIPVLMEVFQISGVIPKNTANINPDEVAAEVTKQENPTNVKKDLIESTKATKS